jgi:hypothetical protein
MKRIVCQYMILVSLAFQAIAQPSLEFFTNQANASLQARFGFGVTNIPIYSLTNPAVGYTSAVHYLLQSAVNNYDATTPPTSFGSVFRPLYSWEGPTLKIVGYAAVTNDFYPQISAGFKDLADLTITTNDNVWGIPWVVGAKNQVPAFNEYSYSTQVVASRNIFFTRWTGPGGLPDTNRPPEFTNQMFVLGISNIFGLQAWNFNHTTFTNSVTIVVSNRVSICLTNDYDWGSNGVFTAGTNWVIDSWPAWTGAFRDPSSFVVPQLFNTIPLPTAYWSETAKQFVPVSALTNSLPLAADLMQTGWPVHAWILNVTNELMYSLIDNQSGNVLYYVNLGQFGSSLNITNILLSSFGAFAESPWLIGSASDASNSPMCSGMFDQIEEDLAQDALYYDSLNGRVPNEPGPVFRTPYNPTNIFVHT